MEIHEPTCTSGFQGVAQPTTHAITTASTIAPPALAHQRFRHGGFDSCAMREVYRWAGEWGGQPLARELGPPGADPGMGRDPRLTVKRHTRGSGVRFNHGRSPQPENAMKAPAAVLLFCLVAVDVAA